MMSSVTPLRSDAAMALSDGALPNHARLPIIAQSPCTFRVLDGDDYAADSDSRPLP
jgi:hypothetical protein